MEDGEEVDPADDGEGFEGEEGEEEERRGARGKGEASVRNEARDLAAYEESVSKVGGGGPLLEAWGPLTVAKRTTHGARTTASPTRATIGLTDFSPSLKVQTISGCGAYFSASQCFGRRRLGSEVGAANEGGNWMRPRWIWRGSGS